jgi:hypothetical protein
MCSSCGPTASNFADFYTFQLPYSVAPCPKDQYAEHCAICKLAHTALPLILLVLMCVCAFGLCALFMFTDCTREEHCTGNGYCIQRNALCGCDLGWMGPRCNYFCLAQESCNGQGQCIFNGEETACECTEGFVGDKCQYRKAAFVLC